MNCPHDFEALRQLMSPNKNSTLFRLREDENEETSTNIDFSLVPAVSWCLPRRDTRSPLFQSTLPPHLSQLLML